MADPQPFVFPGQIKGWVAPRRAFRRAFTGTIKAGGAATGGRLVEYTTPGLKIVDTAAADSSAVAGVAMHDAAAGEPISVAVDGVWNLTADGAITAGQQVVSSDDGTVKALSGTAAAADAREIVGIAQNDAADTAAVQVELKL
jgi:predicted RecA/RadA family phage recombinase